MSVAHGAYLVYMVHHGEVRGRRVGGGAGGAGTVPRAARRLVRVEIDVEQVEDDAVEGRTESVAQAAYAGDDALSHA